MQYGQIAQKGMPKVFLSQYPKDKKGAVEKTVQIFWRYWDQNTQNTSLIPSMSFLSDPRILFQKAPDLHSLVHPYFISIMISLCLPRLDPLTRINVSGGPQHIVLDPLNPLFCPEQTSLLPHQKPYLPPLML